VRLLEEVLIVWAREIPDFGTNFLVKFGLLDQFLHFFITDSASPVLVKVGEDSAEVGQFVRLDNPWAVLLLHWVHHVLWRHVLRRGRGRSRPLLQHRSRTIHFIDIKAIQIWQIF
jgi:hypothetical protein